MIESLPPLRTLNGKFDAYCHVCWNPVYRLWVSDESPDHNTCQMGDYTARTCPDALARARNTAMFADLRAKGLLPTNTLTCRVAPLSASPQTVNDGARDEPLNPLVPGEVKP